MGIMNNLLYNNKRLCPVCGCAVPRFFGTKIEEITICNECKEKIDLPKEEIKNMTIEDFRKYLNFYEENRPLRMAFRETARFKYDSLIVSVDESNGLFRFHPGKLVFQASCMKGVYAWEDEILVANANNRFLKFYETDVLEKAYAILPSVIAFRTEHTIYMFRKARYEAKGKTFYETEPEFKIDPPVKNILLKLEIDHPYWPDREIDRFLCFSRYNPSVKKYLNQYQKIQDELHPLVRGLALLMNPDVEEECVPLESQ